MAETKAFVDTATLHTALNEVSQGKSGSLSAWHRRSLLDVTFLLLQNNMRLINRIGRNKSNVKGETPDVIEFAKALSSVSFSRARVRAGTKEEALTQTLDWLEIRKQFLNHAWQTTKTNKDLWDWLLVQRVFRIIQHSELHGQLFEEEFIPFMAELLQASPTHLKNIYDISTKPNLIKKLLENPSEPDLELLTQAWLLGGMIRGKYYELLSKAHGTQIALHLFRHPIEEQLEITYNQNINRTQQTFVNLLVGSALIQKQPYRVPALAYNIELARKFLFTKDKDARIELEEKQSIDKSDASAFDAARKVGLMGGTAESRKLLQILSSASYPTLIGLGVATWVGQVEAGATTLVITAANLAKKYFTDESYFESMTKSVANSNIEFKRLAKVGGGRIKTEIVENKELK